MLRSADINRFEIGLALVLILCLFLTLLENPLFDKIFLFAGFSCMLYYCLRMYLSFRDWSQNKILSIGGFILFLAATFEVMGSIAAFQKDPRAAQFLWLCFGLLGVVVVGILAFAFLTREKKEPLLRPWVISHAKRFAFLGLLAAGIFFMWE